MTSTMEGTGQAAIEPSMRTLREVVETLAELERGPCSPGERQAAEWIAERLRAVGVDEVALEDEPSWGTFPPTATGLSALGALGARLTVSGRRLVGGALSALALAGFLDEVGNGPRLLRRAVRRRRTTVNVVAKLGDPDAERTLVVLAHHDAAQSGFLFDQRAVAALHERFPGVIPRIKTQPPMWWPAFAGPALGALAALAGRRGAARVALGLCLAGVVVLGDMWRNRVVPGANDNLSAVAAIVALAELLREQPQTGLRVWLVSAGAEETLQDGIRAFMERHREELPRERTWFLNLDTIGSPRLVMLEGEGPVLMEHFDAEFRDLVFGAARARGVRVERGFRARASTDAIIPHRYGYRTANVTSLNDYHHLTHYHLPSDTPENLHFDTVREGARLAYAVAERLARG